MRIALLQGAFFPVPAILGGAVEKMWFSLGKEFVRQGHEVTQISRHVNGLPLSELIDGVNHIRIAGFDTPKSGLVLKFFDLIYTWRTRFVFLTDFDIIITNTFWAPIILPAKAKRVCVVDVARIPKGQMVLYKHVARLRANSTPVANAIRAEVNRTQQTKVVMIPNPLPFIPMQDVDFSLKKPIILYVGRIHPEKGLDLLINAYRRTSQTYRLQLVGPWEVSNGGGGIDYLDSLKKLAGDAAIDFVGPVFDIDILNKFYIDASVFVYPSVAEKGETFGLSPLEAMAWGCVPVVSNLSCFQDFITQEENGLIFDHRSQHAVQQLAEHIMRLQEDNKLQKKLGQNALLVRKTHSIQHIADLFLKEFAHVVNQSTHLNVSAIENS